MYVIVGASGFLGSYLVDEILSSTNEKIVAVYHNIKGLSLDDRIEWTHCDITDFSEVEEMNEKYKGEEKKVVMLTACHNPDFVANNPRIAWNINIVALSNFVNTLEDVNAFIYPSTDSVYGNSIEGHRYSELDNLNPVNIYGKQKVLAEHIVTSAGYNVVRLPFMIGHSLAQGKKHFYDSIVDNLSNNREVEMFADSYRSTLSFRQVARYILNGIEYICESKDYPQIINLCADEPLSKYDVGRMIARNLKVPEELVRPIYLSDNSTVFKTPRADSTIMDNSLMKKWFEVDKVIFDVTSC